MKRILKKIISYFLKKIKKYFFEEIIQKINFLNLEFVKLTTNVGKITQELSSLQQILSSIESINLNSRLHSLINYQNLVNRLIKENPIDLAMAKAVGSETAEEFFKIGQIQFEVLKKVGLNDNMSIYDLGSGSGRTAFALNDNGFKGKYYGHDLINTLVEYQNKKLPNFKSTHHLANSLVVEDNSIDIVYAWSVFTHLYLEEIYIYLLEIHKKLKQNGTLVFSYLSIDDTSKFDEVFLKRVESFKYNIKLDHLDTFLNEEIILNLAKKSGYKTISFENGTDTKNHPAFGQSLAYLKK